MPRLALPIDQLKKHYTVVVIGSGYGGAIAASRLARAGQKVCVLERGKEFQPGEYPDTECAATSEMQATLPEGHVGSRTGLYDFHVNEQIHVFVGCGLGGTSLVNANVSLRADKRVFEDVRWPEQLRNDVNTRLDEGYSRAEEMLKPRPYPQDFPTLSKLTALSKSADHLKQRFYRPPINVTFEDGVNHVGVQQSKCVLCGDCVTGCNHASKNTVLMNYLPDAKNYGAEIFTQVAVRKLERGDKGWLVHFQVLGSGTEKFDAPTEFIQADLVVLSAGTLGSTEILLRSGAGGLSLSDRVGYRFTGNGDVLAFSYNGDEDISGIGFGHHPVKDREPVGPCITGIIDIRNQPKLTDGMVIEEGSVPGALATFFPEAMGLAAELVGKDTSKGFFHRMKEKARELDSLVRGAYHGATKNTQTYLVMTHDDGDGRMELVNDQLRIKWPGVGDESIFQRVDARLKDATVPLGGTYVKDPIWSKMLQNELISVHPLGGCVMAENAEQGVVNHKGQVFSGKAGSGVYEGLYVCDGSVIPVPLGVNPLLTISALAERCCNLIAKDQGWKFNTALPSRPATPPPPEQIGLSFTETMRGSVDLAKQPGSPFEFTLTVISDDLAKMLKDPNHPAKMMGTVTAPGLSGKPLSVEGGDFSLFVEDREHVETRLMRYRMKMTSEENKTYFMDGKKIIRDGSGFDVWKDTTTLYINVYDGSDEKSELLGPGILTISAGDFARQLTTLKVLNASTELDRLRAVASFGEFFGGILFQTYGGIFARETVFNPEAPPRKRRTLAVDAPEVHFFETSDKVTLQLTRYRGGARGPVILSHGLGVSSSIFSIDTIETNLLEYLFAHGYDVWLLDYRASIALPPSSTLFSADDVALKDYPAAVNAVLGLTGAKSVQMVVHCFGSTTFFMAMLGGLRGVRSAVASQIATHIKPPLVTEIKSGLHLPSFLEALGVKSLSAYVDKDADWKNRLFNDALRLYPTQAQNRCQNPVCHRITFMYAPLYEHDELNEATHEALHEMFGVANIRAFEHLALMVRKGHLVNFGGEDSYLPHLERLALPIRFIHGANNECFLPESTEITFDLLREKNGKALYDRFVIPKYGHIDCIFGRDAVRDVYPLILEHLEKTL